ncbi:hypothetical protein VTN00DRAFT_732 [Thermoascus crustaceus]|uniref:uncharacterized protein n=1 Tax=Thermoascus crustaceus TaxID=5088 RepID=UPI003742C23E
MASNREERLQMRQRGAGTRKIKEVDFGFSFGSPILPPPQPTRPEPQPAPSVPEPRPPSRRSTPEKQPPSAQRSPRGTPSGSQGGGTKIRTPGSSRNHLPERPSTFDIPSDDSPEQGRSSKRRKIDVFKSVPEEAPPDVADAPAVQPDNEATSIPVEQTPELSGEASRDISSQVSPSQQNGLEQPEPNPPIDIDENTASAVEQAQPENEAAPTEESPKSKRRKPKSTTERQSSERPSVERTREQDNVQVETQEPAEPVVPEEPQETVQEEATEERPEEPRQTSKQPEKRRRGRPPATVPAAPNEDKSAREEEAHSPEQGPSEAKNIRKAGRPRKQRPASTPPASPGQQTPGEPDAETAEAEPEPGLPDREEREDEGQDSPQRPLASKRKKRKDLEEEREDNAQDAPQEPSRTRQKKRKGKEEQEEKAQGSPPQPSRTTRKRKDHEEQPDEEQDSDQRPSRTRQKKRNDNEEQQADEVQDSPQQLSRARQKKSKNNEEEQEEEEAQDSPQQPPTAKQKGKKPVGRPPIRNNRRSLPAVQVAESISQTTTEPKEQQHPEVAEPSEGEPAAAPKPRRGRPSGSKNGIRKSIQPKEQEPSSSRQAEEQEAEAEAEAEGEDAAEDKDNDKEPKPKRKFQRGETVPVTVHRLANTAALDDAAFSDSAESDADSAADDELSSRKNQKPFPTRSGVNPADVLSQICRETLDKTLATLKTGIANEPNAAKRAEWTRKRKAVEAFATELEGRLFEMSEVLDSNFVLNMRLRRAKREMGDLRNRLVQVRRRREEVAIRMDEVRRRHAEGEGESMSRSSINNSLHSLELALDRSRHNNNNDDDDDEPSTAGLEFTLRSLAQDVSSSAPGSQGGLLHLIKSFNAQLERTARALEGGSGSGSGSSQSQS